MLALDHVGDGQVEHPADEATTAQAVAERPPVERPGDIGRIVGHNAVTAGAPSDCGGPGRPGRPCRHGVRTAAAGSPGASAPARRSCSSSSRRRRHRRRGAARGRGRPSRARGRPAQPAVRDRPPRRSATGRAELPASVDEASAGARAATWPGPAGQKRRGHGGRVDQWVGQPARPDSSSTSTRKCSSSPCRRRPRDDGRHTHHVGARLPHARSSERGSRPPAERTTAGRTPSNRSRAASRNASWSSSKRNARPPLLPLQAEDALGGDVALVSRWCRRRSARQRELQPSTTGPRPPPRGQEVEGDLCSSQSSSTPDLLMSCPLPSPARRPAGRGPCRACRGGRLGPHQGPPRCARAGGATGRAEAHRQHRGRRGFASGPPPDRPGRARRGGRTWQKGRRAAASGPLSSPSWSSPPSSRSPRRPAARRGDGVVGQEGVVEDTSAKPGHRPRRPIPGP